MAFLHFLNGRWVEEKYLQISINDLSVLRGYGIFDFLRTYHQKPFRLEDHINRFFSSAKIVGINQDWEKEYLTDLVIEGLNKNRNEAKDFNIRILGTGGVGVDSVTPGKASLIIMYFPAVNYPNEYYENGVKIITYLSKRVLPEAKTLNYLEGIIALQSAKKQKALEAIYVDVERKMYEGTTSNLFGVMDQKLITPKNEILKGITRKVVLEIADKLDIELIERDIYLEDISSFEEAFITASNKEVMPVVRIDRSRVADGKVGKITKKIILEFNKITESS